MMLVILSAAQAIAQSPPTPSALIPDPPQLSPARADRNDLHLNLAKQHGCNIVVDTDAHAAEELEQMRFGITQLRRAWLSAADILNTLHFEQFIAGLRPRP